jgi:hypothetical protein
MKMIRSVRFRVTLSAARTGNKINLIKFLRIDHGGGRRWLTLLGSDPARLGAP